jgi:hypothetical protein
MTKFKVGDRVKCIKGYEPHNTPHSGWTGTVRNVHKSKNEYVVDWDGHYGLEDVDAYAIGDFLKLITDEEPITEAERTKANLLPLMEVFGRLVNNGEYLSAQTAAMLRDAEGDSDEFRELQTRYNGVIEQMVELAKELGRLQRDINDLNNPAQ